MRRLIPVFGWALATLLGGAEMVWSADFQKGLEAAKRGDYAAALREWKPLAEQGHAQAQRNLGAMYESGQGVSQNHKTAVEWYRRAAEQGHAQAQDNLGFMYYSGQGIPQDHKIAVEWYRRAAEQQHAGAQQHLGLLYENGHGVARDYVYAYMWFNLSFSSEDIDRVSQRMTSGSIAEAQRLARECIRKNHKEC